MGDSPSATPSALTLKLMRDLGWVCCKETIVERTNFYTQVKVDLLNIIDMLAFAPGTILGIQATSMSNNAARVTKLHESDGTRTWLNAGGALWVVSWKKYSEQVPNSRSRVRPTITTFYMQEENVLSHVLVDGRKDDAKMRKDLLWQRTNQFT